MNLCLSGFSLNTGTHEKKSWVISIRKGGCCNLFYVHFFTRIFFFLLEGTWVYATWISVRVRPSTPALLVSLSLCCGSAGSPVSTELDTAPLANPPSPPHWINVKPGQSFLMGGFLRAQAGLKFSLKELVHLDLTFRSLGCRSVILAADPSSCSWGGLGDIWIKFLLAKPMNMKVSSLLTLEETGLEFRSCIKSQSKMQWVASAYSLVCKRCLLSCLVTAAKPQHDGRLSLQRG